MLNLTNNYKFLTNFSFYINFNNSFIILSNKYKYYKFKISSIYFYKNNNKILFLNLFFFKTFINLILYYYNRYFIFYYFQLKLKGLGFRIRVLSNNLIKLFFNRSNYYYMHIPSSIIFKYRTRRLFFISNSYIVLRLSILNLLFLKKYLTYRFNGLIYLRQIILMKPGKNKFR